MLELNKLPTTSHIQINEMLRQFEGEALSAFRKVHKMIDLFETIIKTHTAAIMGSYFSLKNISDDIKSLLAFGLKTPSLGTWLLFSREIMSDLSIPKKLSKEQYEFSISKLSHSELRSIVEKCYIRTSEEYFLDVNSMKNIKDGKKKLIKCFGLINKYEFSPEIINKDFYSYYWKWIKNISDGNSLTKQDVISLRNNYAHGATPSEEECEADIKAYFPLLNKMLEEAWLYSTKVIDYGYVKENKRIYLSTESGKLIDLFPILQDYNGKLYFLNDLKNFENSRSEISMLNYPYAEHIKLSNISDELLLTMNIIEWKKNYSLNSEFINRINELSENFKGRSDEIKLINDFIKMDTKGTFLVTGNPGVGKSSIIARIIHACKNEKSVENVEVIEYFIRRNTQQNQAKKLLKYLHDRLDNIYNSRIRYENNIEQDRENLRKKLQIISRNLGKKLIIIVDGLDEAIESTDDNILNYIPSEIYENVIYIYSGRWTSEIKEFYLKLPVEEKKLLQIRGLKKEDIRAMLYEVCNKYELEKNSRYVDRILEVSQGNPLFLKLLCLDIEKGIKRINNMETLPNNLDSFYEEILFRLEKKEKSSLILDSLYLITAAYDYVSPMFLELCLGLSSSEQQYILGVLQEILYESSEKMAHFQIYHESLREYILKYRKEQVMKAHNRLINFCKLWKENNEKTYLSEHIRGYAAKYFSKHISAVEAVKEMEELILGERSKEFIEYQYSITEQFEISFETYKEALALFLNKDDLQSVGICGIKLLELHSKIDGSVNQIFNWVKSKDESLILKALERVKAYNGLEKNNLYNLMLYYICKSALVDSRKKALLEYAISSSESYLEIVEKKYDLPSFVLALVLKECMRLQINFSNLIKMQFKYYKVNCEDIRGYRKFIFGILESFINNSEIESCIRIIDCAEDCEIAVDFAAHLIRILYEKDNLINDIALDYFEKSIDEVPLGIDRVRLCSNLFSIPWNKENNKYINNYLNMLFNESYAFAVKQGTKIQLRYLMELAELINKYELSKKYCCIIKSKLDSIEIDEDTDIHRYLNILILINERDSAKVIFKNWFNEFCDIHLRKSREANYMSKYKGKVSALAAMFYICELFEEGNEFRKKYLDNRELDDYEIIMISSILSESRNFKLIAKIALMFENNSEAQENFVKYILFTERNMNIDFIKESNLIEQSQLYKLILEKRTLENRPVMQRRRYKENLEKGNSFEEILLRLKDNNEKEAINSFNIMEEGMKEQYSKSFSEELYKRGYFSSAEKVVENHFILKKEKLKTTFDVEEYTHYLNSINFLKENDTNRLDDIDIEIFSEGLKGHIPSRLENESLDGYILRAGRYMLVNNKVDELLRLISQVDNQIYLEDFVIGLQDYFIKEGYVKQLLELDNRLEEDVYYKTQPILALIQYMAEKKEFEKNKQYIETACRVIDSQIIKDSFIRELILYVDCFSNDIPRYIAVIMPHIIKSKQFVADLTAYYWLFQWFRNRENCSTKFLAELNMLISIESSYLNVDELNKIAVFTIDNEERWFSKIQDQDDREDVKDILERYSNSEIDREKAIKRLNRITKEYGFEIE